MAMFDPRDVAPAETEFVKPNGHAEPLATGGLRLINKLCAAGAAIGWIEKSGRNQFHGYAYATEADLVAALRGELYKRNVFVFPTVLTQERKPITVTSKNGVRETALTDVMIRWTFVDGDTGERFECDVPGCGEDSGDKGIYKAMTGSEKYLLMKAFLIPTGDDPERDTEPEKKQAFQNGKEAAQAVATRKIAASVTGHATDAAKFATSAPAHVEKGAAQPGGKAAALKVVTFTDDTIMREWKGVPRPWQKIDGDGLGTLLTGMETHDPHFKREFMWCDEGEYLWYVMKAKADILAEAAVSMGLDAKRSTSQQREMSTEKGRVSQVSDPTGPQGSEKARRVTEIAPNSTDDAKPLQYVKLIDKGVTNPFIVMRYGDTEYSCFEQSIWDYLERGSGKLAKLELSKPVKKNGKSYQNIIAVDQIGDRTYSDNVPDRYPSDLGEETPTY